MKAEEIITKTGGSLTQFMAKVQAGQISSQTLEDPGFWIAFGILFITVLFLLFVFQWIFVTKQEALVFQPVDSVDRLATIESILNDLRCRHAEQMNKMQGEILFLKQEIDFLREPVEQLVGLATNIERGNS